MFRTSIVIAVVCLLTFAGAPVRAQIAADSAQNYPATAGSGIWNNGDNGGFGFQPWQFSNTNGNAGIYIGDSQQNGGPPDPEGFQSKGINSPNGRSWGLFANSGGFAQVVRPFQAALGFGQTFSADWDTGFIDNGGSDGIRLSDNSAGLELWQIVFFGGQNTYSIIDGSGTVTTTLPFTDDGLHVAFTLTGPTTYSATITEADGPTQTITGSLEHSGSVSQFAFYDQNAGFNATNNVYANNLLIVPEPTTVALFAIGAAVAMASVRRTR
jgi:hypothetical protein